MDEVDGIIIHTLKAIGCEIGEDVQSITQFTTELIVEAVATCVKIIRNDLQVQHRLPPSMSAKFRIGTGLANAVKEIGYQGEVGYQTFLYSNETEIRKVFIFLLEKMPKESSQGVEQVTGASVLLERAIANEVRLRLNSPWTPPFCKRKNGICWRGTPPSWQRQGCRGINHFTSCHIEIADKMHDITTTTSPPPKDLLKYYTNHLDLVSEQTQSQFQTTQAVLEYNSARYTEEAEWDSEWSHSGILSRLTPQQYRARKKDKLREKFASHIKQSLSIASEQSGLESSSSSGDMLGDRGSRMKKSRFTHIENLRFGADDEKINAQIQPDLPREATEEELQEKRQQEMSDLQQELEAVSATLEQLQLDMKKYSAGQLQMQEQLDTVNKENETNKENYKVKKRTLDLLPDAENNIEKLQEMVETSAQRLVTLANQWEKHRAPLIENYREMKALNETRQSETEKKLDEIKSLREKMREVATDAKQKEEVYKQLVAEYERMGKDVNRAAYTKRIMEIVANIKKQKRDIDKVLVDTRAIQKEINQLTGKLDRTFTVTDELVFRDAKKDESVRRAYKFLAALHENCNAVMNTVEETGVILREIRDLEDQIEQESNNKVLANLQKITEDYKLMKKENSVLMAKWKTSQQRT